MTRRPRLTLLPPRVGVLGAATRQEQNRGVDQRRGSAASRGYDAKWAKASAGYRADHPLCEYCSLEDKVAPTACTDHLYPVSQFEGVFWRREWWVACCTDCHAGFKQALERRGKAALDALARRLGRPTHD